MKHFNHPNVMTLIGVCLDGGPAPYIVLPFMANGSLLSYLTKERVNLIVRQETTFKPRWVSLDPSIMMATIVKIKVLYNGKLWQGFFNLVIW